MAIIKREDLKQPFSQGKILTQKDFCNLIDSMLNRREDRFFGQWQPNVEYKPGDVVLFGAENCDTKLYVLQPEPIPAGGDKSDVLDIGYCAQTFDRDRWHIMELSLEDDDWHVVAEGVENPGIDTEDGDRIMFARIYGKIGIGTECPEARLDILTDEVGQIQLKPDELDDPTICINKLTPDCDSTLAISSGEKNACLLTDAPMGFMLKQETESEGQDGETISTEQLLVLTMVDPEDNRVKLGVNQNAPKAMLDIIEEEFGQWMVLPDGCPYPETILLNLNDECDTNYISTRLSEERVEYRTDAPKGYLFKGGNDWKDYKTTDNTEAEESILSVLPGPMVGIGTAAPETVLDVTDNECGRLQFSPEIERSPNPALSIINTKPHNNYLTIGTDNEKAIFVTDAVDGFVFKAGGDYGTDNNHLRLNQGTSLVKITKEGEVGIGKNTPQGYQLDVFGKVQAYGYFTPAPENERIDECIQIKDVLEDLCQLTSVKFTWKEEIPNCDSEKYQIGILKDDLADCFPDLVKKVGDRTSINYPSLVAFLLQGIKEQQTQIKDLEDKLQSLDDRLCALEDN